MIETSVYEYLSSLANKVDVGSEVVAPSAYLVASKSWNGRNGT